MKKADGDDIFFVDPMIFSRVTQIVDDTSPSHAMRNEVAPLKKLDISFSLG